MILLSVGDANALRVVFFRSMQKIYICFKSLNMSDVKERWIAVFNNSIVL